MQMQHSHLDEVNAWIELVEAIGKCNHVGCTQYILHPSGLCFAHRNMPSMCDNCKCCKEFNERNDYCTDKLCVGYTKPVRSMQSMCDNCASNLPTYPIESLIYDQSVVVCSGLCLAQLIKVWAPSSTMRHTVRKVTSMFCFTKQYSQSSNHAMLCLQCAIAPALQDTGGLCAACAASFEEWLNCCEYEWLASRLGQSEIVFNSSEV